ncbi:ribosomal-protein-alanine N-acetyltransferase [Bowdeniella nasicola]|uniref:Ribosomal-protein-alanine N-acetyltransferase n=1 Tax=Bowdeniella nasicola TaxID=208480 RepID=A0A1Q5Q5Y5_9ACTO|nr:ribosomal protein S18-alanine N-acetyltransferase [Bowdeniella nasicola]OKL55040.1 ribosomal-protein-alanine N-acetyltransferase [Bowdeniella nasicola]
MLRDLTASDLERVMRLEAELFGPDAWTRSLYEAELARPDRIWRAVELDGAVVAYGGITIALQSDLMTIGVTESHQGRGIGAQLLTDLTAAAQSNGARELFLEVRADNEIAQRLYLRHGFEQLGIRPRYYRGGIAAVVMRLTLREVGVGPVGAEVIT